MTRTSSFCTAWIGTVGSRKGISLSHRFRRLRKPQLGFIILTAAQSSSYSVGYYEHIISRPQLYDLLFNSVPRERILLSKRILSCTQNRDKVIIECSDNSSYFGDILVGADGAYSAVRQHLYKQLKADKKLPTSSSDDVSLPFSCVCLVGQTVPLEPEEFPHLKEELSQTNSVLGVSTMCTVSVVVHIGLCNHYKPVAQS